MLCQNTGFKLYIDHMDKNRTLKNVAIILTLYFYFPFWYTSRDQSIKSNIPKYLDGVRLYLLITKITRKFNKMLMIMQKVKNILTLTLSSNKVSGFPDQTEQSTYAEEADPLSIKTAALDIDSN